jgi:hypothetical protein
MASKGRASPPAIAPKASTGSPKARGTDKDKEQSARFKETARALGADNDSEAFERAMDVIAKPRVTNET